MLELDREVGRAVAQLREQRGKKQTQVAQSLGWQQPLVSKLENGERSLKVAELKNLAKALDVPCEELSSLIAYLLNSGDMDDAF